MTLLAASCEKTTSDFVAKRHDSAPAKAPGSLCINVYTFAASSYSAVRGSYGLQDKRTRARARARGERRELVRALNAGGEFIYLGNESKRPPDASGRTIFSKTFPRFFLSRFLAARALFATSEQRPGKSAAV